MPSTARVEQVGLLDALSKGPPPAGNLAIPVFRRGTVVVEIYAPDKVDPQKPHTRDELYFVARGKGFFYEGGRRKPVEVGSFIFVPAGAAHRFEDFSADFVVWVVFYGAEGGEQVAESDVSR